MPRPIRLERPFFAVTPQRLAAHLLGQLLVRRLADGQRLSGRIVETEAYAGVKDRASHAFGGRRTPRNESMYAQPGTAYVYFTYGMHFCMNIVCGRFNQPVAVLLRALEPLEGLDAMRHHRSPSGGPLRDRDLCSGPGKLCQALAIDRALDGTDLCRSHTLWLEPAPCITAAAIRRDARIGISNAGDWTRKPLRWLVAGNPHVSRGPQPNPSPQPLQAFRLTESLKLPAASRKRPT